MTKDEWLKAGEELFHNASYEESITYFERIAAKFNPDTKVQKLLAWNYIKINKYQEALDTFQRIIADERDSRVVYGIGICYYFLEKHDLAIKYLEHSLQNEKGNQEVYDLLKKAIKKKKRSLGFYDPGKAKTHKLRGDQFMVFQDYKKAILNYKEAVKFDPENVEYTDLLSKVTAIQKPRANGGEDKDSFIQVDFERVQGSPGDATRRMADLIGLRDIKSEIEALVNFLSIEKLRRERGLFSNDLMLHMVFKGSPGTGKTMVARLLGEILKNLGFLKNGHVVEVSRNDLVAEYMGQTAVKANNCINSAIDGILFIDEAYSLFSDSAGDYGKEAINVLLKRMEDERNRLVVIIAGYPDEIEQLLNSNPGLKSRFNRHFFFSDYAPLELLDINRYFAQNRNFTINPDAEDLLLNYYEQAYGLRDKTFGNARFVRNLFEEIIISQSNRLSKTELIHDQDLQIITIHDVEDRIKERIIQPEQTPEEIFAEMELMLGLDAVKQEIRSLIKYLKVEAFRKEKGLQKNPLTLHFVFFGSPGTGKTTIARFMGKLFRAIGLLKKGHVVEADRSKLVGEYVGQTAIKTNKLIDSALDGILFIDEAYTLQKPGFGNNDYGQEAIDTLLKRMEDDREKLIVIVAGYTDLMKLFIESNPGLKSRFTKYVEFPDFNASELHQIFQQIARQRGYSISEGLNKILENYFKEVVLQEHGNHGNGRMVRNLFDRVIQVHSGRIADLMEISSSDLVVLTESDFNPESLKSFF